uniref:Uncharacterized protein n=1 Tax=Arundo donax TaxID=35708 RepID=A0A0A8Y0G8_ARUDO
MVKLKRKIVSGVQMLKENKSYTIYQCLHEESYASSSTSLVFLFSGSVLAAVATKQNIIIY